MPEVPRREWPAGLDDQPPAPGPGQGGFFSSRPLPVWIRVLVYLSPPVGLLQLFAGMDPAGPHNDGELGLYLFRLMLLPAGLIINGGAVAACLIRRSPRLWLAALGATGFVYLGFKVSVQLATAMGTAADVMTLGP